MRSKLGALIMLVLGIAVGTGGVLAYVRLYPPPPAPIEKARTPLYYRNPMDPSITSSVPAKDSMGMDYVPVYEEDSSSVKKGAIRISPEKLERAGVKSEAAARMDLKIRVRTVGRVEPIESRVFAISTKAGGWVEKLHVNRTDQMVSRGEPLLEIYSPELVATQEEYLLALKAHERASNATSEDFAQSARTLLNAAQRKLGYLDVTDEQMERLKKTRRVERTIAIASPSSGNITEKMVVEGQKVEAGELLFKVIDHSMVWVWAEVYESDLPFIRSGQDAVIYPSYSPQEAYRARVEHIYSHLGSIRYEPGQRGEEARTAKVRFQLKNPKNALKPGMFVNVEIDAGATRNSITVPDSAVMDTGERKIVIVDLGDARFEPREVSTGISSEGRYEIKSGVSEGELVVTSANFLIDSEANLRAVLGTMSGKKAGSNDKGPSAPKEIAPQGGHAGH